MPNHCLHHYLSMAVDRITKKYTYVVIIDLVAYLVRVGGHRLGVGDLLLGGRQGLQHCLQLVSELRETTCSY